MNDKKMLTWDEVSSFASGKFDVWANNAGTLWAEKAWNMIIKAGLADYEDEIERHIVVVRLLTLAVMYNEFCDLVWDEYFDYGIIGSYDWMTDENFFNPIRVRQLIGQDFYTDEVINEEDEDSVLSQAIIELIDKQRPIVYNVLKKGFGFDLFFSLLLTRYSKEDGSEYGIDTITEREREELKLDYDKLDQNEEKGSYWVSIGMPRSPKENI